MNGFVMMPLADVQHALNLIRAVLDDHDSHGTVNEVRLVSAETALARALGEHAGTWREELKAETPR